ncbi:hypothetical protein ACFQ0D_37220, partial [Micromonospora zhanjiangensis]
HSSAALPEDAAAVLAALGPGARFVELFGSTETGLVATRTSPDDPEWTLAPDVTFGAGSLTRPDTEASAGADHDTLLPAASGSRSEAPAGPGTFGPGGARPVPLVVRSPRLARRPGEPVPTELRLDDLVTVTGPDTFRWHRRRGELVKVNGRRVELDAVLARLAVAAPGVRLSARPHRDGLRGEWFTVLVHTADAAAVAAV